jgi:hypothetical protein
MVKAFGKKLLLWKLFTLLFRYSILIETDQKGVASSSNYLKPQLKLLMILCLNLRLMMCLCSEVQKYHYLRFWNVLINSLLKHLYQKHLSVSYSGDL